MIQQSLRSEFAPDVPKLMKTTWVRWLYLLFCSLLTIGTYYCYDNPQALQVHIQEDLNISASFYNALYGVYSFPNLIIPLFGGFFIDKIGEHAAVLLFTFIVASGQAVFLLGGYYENFILMIIGRIIFGAGSDCTIISQSAVISKWFRGKELAFALMVGLLCSRFSSSLNAFLTPILYDTAENLWFPLLGGLVMSVLSLLSGIVVILMDLKEAKNVEKMEGQFEHVKVKKASIYYAPATESAHVTKDGDYGSQSRAKLDPSDGVFPVKSDPEIQSPSDTGRNDPNHTERKDKEAAKNDQEKEEEEEVSDKFSCQDLVSFSGCYWWLQVSSACNNVGFFVFLNVANLFLSKRFGITSSTAGSLLTVFYLSSGICNAIFGKVVDLKGQRVNIIFYASIILTICHGLFMILPDMEEQIYAPIAPLALLGLSSAMFASAFYPALPLLVPPKKTGTAFGVAFCVLNIGLAVLPEVGGYIYDNTQSAKYGYFWVSCMLTAVSAFGIIAILVVMVYYKEDAAFLNRKNTKSTVSIMKKVSVMQ